jgi:hypothetical protein
MYNMKVKLRLGLIIDDYKAEAENVRNKIQDCDIRKMTALSREKLEELSGECYESITDFGKSSPGKPLVDLPGLGMRS